MAPPAGESAPEAPRDLVIAVDAYADYLRVERGLAAATILGPIAEGANWMALRLSSRANACDPARR